MNRCSILLSLLPACVPKMTCPREQKAVALFVPALAPSALSPTVQERSCEETV